MFLTRLAVVIFCASALLAAPPVVAQNKFRAVIDVNEDVITEWEIEQRVLFLKLTSPALATPGRAREDLIRERLQMQAARQVGLELTPLEIEDGIAEFASRADITAEEFLGIAAEEGIDPETIRSFVEAGIAWRELIRGRFGQRAEISEAEIDRALAATQSAGGLRVLVSEVIIPAPPERIDLSRELAGEIAQSRSFSEFSDYARRFSAAPTRDQGGRLDWTPLNQLPGPLRPVIAALAPGDVTEPIELPNAIAVFQLRGIQETSVSAPNVTAIDYAQYLIPGGRTEATLAEAARLRSEVDVCDDLYGVAQGQPPERLLRESRAPSEIPQRIGQALAALDPGEVSTALTTTDGQALIFLMLCGRSTVAADEADRDVVAQQLRQRRLSELAEAYVEQLRAEARIRER